MLQSACRSPQHCGRPSTACRQLRPTRYDEPSGAQLAALPTSLEALEWRQSKGWLWVACHQKKGVVGLVAASIVDGHAHLEELAVDPRHARRGLGSRLVLAVVEWADEHGFEGVSLSTSRVVPWNRPFYERLGFRELPPGRWGPGLEALRAAEIAAGLDPATRVMMWRPGKKTALPIIGRCANFERTRRGESRRAPREGQAAMGIEYRISPEEKTAFVTVRGQVDVRAALAAMGRLANDPAFDRSYKIVIDVREMDYRPSLGELRVMAWALGHERQRYADQVAVVLPEQAGRVRPHIFARFARMAGVGFNLFRDLPSALRWSRAS